VCETLDEIHDAQLAAVISKLRKTKKEASIQIISK
jgi:hypothetical protein